jgi:hypothetical protein
LKQKRELEEVIGIALDVLASDEPTDENKKFLEHVAIIKEVVHC